MPQGSKRFLIASLPTTSPRVEMHEFSDLPITAPVERHVNPENLLLRAELPTLT